MSPLMFADVVINTSPVFTRNVALLAPRALSRSKYARRGAALVSATRAPRPARSGLAATVPVRLQPANNVAGFKLSDATVGSSTGLPSTWPFWSFRRNSR